MRKNKLSLRYIHFLRFVFGVISLLALLILAVFYFRWRIDVRTTRQKQDALIQSKNNSSFVLPKAPAQVSRREIKAQTTASAEEDSPIEYSILPEYQELYDRNPDIIGWLMIDGTYINNPVMQTPDDEEYYLKRGFDREDDENGCFIMDTDSVVGYGTSEFAYEDGEEPSTNLIIHGHAMPSGMMFGYLQNYAYKTYGTAHNIIQFDSLYEKRSYELMAAFYSQVYYTDEDVFKYYAFFQADTQEEFDEWYSNVKGLSLYDTGVTAEFGDSFITLSCCSHHIDNGRFVVVGKRIQ